VIPPAFALLRRFLDAEKGDTSEWLEDALGLLGDLADALEADGLRGNAGAWTLLVAAQRYVKTHGADYVEGWSYPTQAGIAWGGAAALAALVPTEWGPVDFVDELLGVVESVGAECAEDEQALASRTVTFSLLPRGRGAVDRHLGRVVAIYAGTLLRARTEALIEMATSTLASTLQYNAGAALGALLAARDVTLRSCCNCALAGRPPCPLRHGTWRSWSRPGRWRAWAPVPPAAVGGAPLQGLPSQPSSTPLLQRNTLAPS
jgi:hypothetical protein